MSAITTPIPHTPRRTVGSRFAPVANRSRRTVQQLRRWNEGLETDRNATISEMTLRPYRESRHL